MILFLFQVKWLEERLQKVSSERDYYRSQVDMLHKTREAMAATRTSNHSLLNGGAPADLHMSAGHGGQLDLSINGAATVAAAAAAAVAAQQHEDYKRDPAYQNNNNLKIATHRYANDS